MQLSKTNIVKMHELQSTDVLSYCTRSKDIMPIGFFKEDCAMYILEQCHEVTTQIIATSKNLNRRICSC